MLTNATNPAKRWYHRRAPGGTRRRMPYLVAVPLLLDAGGWSWLLGNLALLLYLELVVRTRTAGPIRTAPAAAQNPTTPMPIHNTAAP